MGLLFFWVLMGVLVASLARAKGRSFILWLIYGILIWPIALVHAIVLKDDATATARRSFSGISQKKCPSCAEYVNEQAAVCRYCGHNFGLETRSQVSTNYESGNSFSYSSSDVKTWKCNKCGCTTNLEASQWCKDCNAYRYSMETIGEDEKNIIKDYVQKQLEASDFPSVMQLQNSYFGTSGLQYMTFILPNAKDFDNLFAYKNKLREIIGESPVEDTVLSSESCNSEADVETELSKLKSLFEKELISEEEYKLKKSKILGL